MRAYIVPIDIIGQTPVEEKRVSVPTILLAELLICFRKLQLLYNIFPIIAICVSKSHWNWKLGLPIWNPLSCLSHASQRTFTSIKLHIGLSGFPFSSVSVVELESDCKPWNHRHNGIALPLLHICAWGKNIENVTRCRDSRSAKSKETRLDSIKQFSTQLHGENRSVHNSTVDYKVSC